MTSPQSWTSTFAHTDNATFRMWGSEVNAKLALIGLVQTANTGQINSATSAVCHEHRCWLRDWRFADSLQGTAPFFLKMDTALRRSA